jgi:hypothetical protein
MTKLILILIALCALAGCAHQWTPAELAALKAEESRCGPPTMIGADVWCKSSGQPLPAMLFMPSRGRITSDDQ